MYRDVESRLQRRLRDPNFTSRYFKGNGIDTGSGNDPLREYVELFPLMTVVSWDKAEGDAWS